MTYFSRDEIIGSILEDIYALLNSAIESRDYDMCNAIYEEWREYIIAEENDVIDVLWCIQFTNT